MRAILLSLAVACAIVAAAASSTSAPMPSQVHLAYGAGSDMTVSFAVPNTTDVTAYKGQVMFGTAPESLSTTVPVGVPNQEKCFTESPYTYHVTLSGLAPATKYYYKCGSDAGGYSPVRQFTTKPVDGTPGPVDFVWFGDMGVNNSAFTQRDVARLVADNEIDFVLHVGDISYADDRIPDTWPLGNLYQDLLNQFYDEIQVYSAATAVMTTPGNHEWPCMQGEYLNRLSMPYKASGSTEKQYYSFRYGRMHLQMMSTEGVQWLTHIEPNGTAWNWMKNDLAKAAADKAAGKLDWILVMAHRPLYCSYHWSACCWNNCHNESSAAWDNPYRDHVEDMLLEYGVDLWLNGHTHNWERTLPVRHNHAVNTAASTKDVYVNPTAPAYVTNGAPGDMEIQGHRFLTQPDWSVTRISTVNGTDKSYNTGYSRVTAYNASALQVTFVRASDDVLLDEFWIKRT